MLHGIGVWADVLTRVFESNRQETCFLIQKELGRGA